MKWNFVQLTKKNINDDNGDNINVLELSYRNQDRTYGLPTRFQYIANIYLFLKKNASKLTFTEAQHKEIKSLLDKDTFKVILISDASSKMRIFNYRFVNEIENKGTATPFEKWILII